MKTLFQDLEYLNKHVQDKEGKEFLKSWKRTFIC